MMFNLGSETWSDISRSQQKAGFDQLYLYFQNTTNSHSFYNIESLKGYLANYGFKVKETPECLVGQQSLF